VLRDHAVERVLSYGARVSVDFEPSAEIPVRAPAHTRSRRARWAHTRHGRPGHVPFRTPAHSTARDLTLVNDDRAKRATGEDLPARVRHRQGRGRSERTRSVSRRCPHCGTSLMLVRLVSSPP
jgi:hypothetical protein